jgi:glycosyltransferase involved in cell wall biosynthesis
MKHQKKIAFVSTMENYPWGGSELLWSETALRLVREGHAVAASVSGWPHRAAHLSTLRGAGVEINERCISPARLRPKSVRKFIYRILDPLIRRASCRAFLRWLAWQRPDLICISSGWIGDDQGIMNTCLQSGRPYAVIVQANSEEMWPDDSRALYLLEIYRSARRVFFVSNRNRVLLETQLGIELTNAEVVRNPFNVSRDASPPWPSDSGPTRLACVGRLDPRSKGQDLLLGVLAREPWRSRPLQLSFIGNGVMEEGLRRLARRLGLDQCVEFCGHVDDIERVWTTHHALILPSRYEGLPLVIVEAMLCGRPVIVTDVGGNAEIVQDGITGFVAEAPTELHLRLAMQRAWERRHQWSEIGQAAARAIRRLVPSDPADDFAQRLLELTEARHTSAARPSEIALAKTV